MSLSRIVLAIIIAILFLAAGAYVQNADADDMPQGLGHPQNHTDYFDGYCCNQNDCEMIPNEAVQEVKGGYHVRYRSGNYGGGIVDDFVPYGDKVKMTKRCMDGNCNGACIHPQYNQQGTPDMSKPFFVRCLYIMPST